MIDLFIELCEEQVYWHIWPLEVKETKRRRKIETEIEELKARLANTKKTMVLSNREIRLLRSVLCSLGVVTVVTSNCGI